MLKTQKFNPTNLEKLMKKANLSTNKVAEATGIKAASLHNYLSGNATPPIEVLIKLADFFAVPLDYVVGRCSKDTAGKILKDYGKHFMELRRAPFEAYLVGRTPESGMTYGDGKMESPWPYNLYEAVFHDHFATDLVPHTIVDPDREEGLTAALDSLTPREKLGLLAYYRDGMTLEEVGNLPEFGVQRETTRQILSKGLRKLRHPSRSKVMQYGRALAEQDSAIKKKEHELTEAGRVLLTYELELAVWKNDLDAKARELAKRSEDEEMLKRLDENPEGIQYVYGMHLSDMNLSVRAYNCLARAGVETLGDVIRIIEEGKLLGLRNLGRRSAIEILAKVKELTGKEYNP